MAHVSGWLDERALLSMAYVPPWRRSMVRFSICLAAVAIGMVIWGLSVSASAESESPKSCPAGYTLVDSFCTNADGDVVEPQ
jgi:hypothetical protein